MPVMGIITRTPIILKCSSQSTFYAMQFCFYKFRNERTLAMSLLCFSFLDPQDSPSFRHISWPFISRIFFSKCALSLVIVTNPVTLFLLANTYSLMCTLMIELHRIGRRDQNLFFFKKTMWKTYLIILIGPTFPVGALKLLPTKHLSKHITP